MKELPLQFRKDGYTWTQTARAGDAVVYRQQKPGVERFNVLVVQSHNGREIAGKKMEPAEFLPSSQQWGSLAWTEYTEAKAMERFDNLVRERAQAKLRKESR